LQREYFTMKSIERLTSANKKKLQEMEILLGYGFSDPVLLQKALVHSSFGFEQLDDAQNNETMEFLGDAVLDLVVTDMLFHRFPEIREGELTKLRAGLVRETTLARIARTIRLGDFIMLGKGEEASQGRKKASILAGTFEALIGAIFLDRGYGAALDIVGRHLNPLLPEKKGKILVEDTKSLLQEKLQEQFNRAPIYFLENEQGPDHAKQFTVTVRFNEKVLGTGSGTSKKEAEQRAAAAALETLDSWWAQLRKQHVQGPGNN
jgi:ribonuclease-3